MDADPQSIETNQDSEDQGSTQQARSYECNFCKRGFSNAQALGGHMNIHRKDRAKLKQPPNDTHFPFDIITTKNPSYTPAELECSDVRSATFKWPWLHPRDEDLARDETHVAELRQLPLFVDAPAICEGRRSVGREDRLVQSSQGSVKVELDLELRLGPEPQHEPEPELEPPSLSLSMGLEEFP